MGLEGLGLACRSAATVLPVPALFAEAWIALGALALAILLPAYLLKLARHPKAVLDEFTNPAQLGFCASLPVGMTLVGGGLGPYVPALANAIWWAGVVLFFAFQVWALRRLLAGGIELAQFNGGWMIMLIGGIVVPSSGLALGHPDVSRFMFGVSAVATPMVMGLVFYRTVVGPALPEIMRPTWFIFLVPCSLIYANGMALSGEPASVFLNGVFYSGLLMAAALLLGARRFLAWPFGAPWWAFTFPLDALAIASARYAQIHPTGPWPPIAAVALVLAVFFVVVVLVKTVLAVVRGTLLAAPKAS